MDPFPKRHPRTVLRCFGSRGVTVEHGERPVTSPRKAALANVIHDAALHTVYYTVNNSARADSTRSRNCRSRPNWVCTLSTL